MTDKDKLLALLGEWGVPSSIDEDNDVIVGWERADGIGKVAGYAGFFTAFEFDADGKFVQMGAWE